MSSLFLVLPGGQVSGLKVSSVVCPCRYSSAGRSLLEPLMQRYWEWLVGRVPSWIAPNLITIIGLATNVFTTLVLIYYCPTATEQVSLHYQTKEKKLELDHAVFLLKRDSGSSRVVGNINEVMNLHLKQIKRLLITI